MRKIIIPILVAALLSAPMAVVITFVLFPFWEWLESVTGIESFGHSGPSEWCFVAVYILVLSIFCTVKVLSSKRDV